jgi:hypothetical protein
MTDAVAVIDTDVACPLFRHHHHHLGHPLKAVLSAVVQRYRPLISAITLGEARATASPRANGRRACEVLPSRAAAVTDRPDEPGRPATRPRGWRPGGRGRG